MDDGENVVEFKPKGRPADPLSEPLGVASAAMVEAATRLAEVVQTAVALGRGGAQLAGDQADALSLLVKSQTAITEANELLQRASEAMLTPLRP